VETTYRGTYLAAMTNIIESGLNSVTPLGHGVCKYLWTLPMFHCAGWTFPWSITAIGGIHVCLRKIDYGEIWRYLIQENITHYNAGIPPPFTK
jgi:acyl-CoA synthetase (AMP-forming)/AMP-acid ligase II